MRCGGMCTHSEVLLQRVSILLLQVERRGQGCGCNSNENKECTHMDHEIRGYITGTVCGGITTCSSIMSMTYGCLKDLPCLTYLTRTHLLAYPTIILLHDLNEVMSLDKTTKLRRNKKKIMNNFNTLTSKF